MANFIRHYKPETGFAIKELGKQMNEPNQADFARVKRLARYLKFAKNRGIWIPRGQADLDELKVFSGTDWAGDKITRKGTSPHAIMVGGSCLAD